MAQTFAGGGREIAIEGDGDVFVAADAILDGFGVFLAMNERFPGVNVFGLMEVAVRNERQAFEADVVEDVVAVGDFPRVDQGREFVLVFPEVEGVFAPFAFHDVRMGGNGERALLVDFGDGFGDIEGSINRRFQINAEQVRGGFAGVAVLVEFDAGHDEHLITAPGALAFAFDDGEVFSDLLGAEGEIGELGNFPEQSARVGEMVGDANAIKAAFAVKINDLGHAQFAVGIIGVDVKIAEQHLGMAAVSVTLGRGAHDAFGFVVKEARDFPGRQVAFGFAEDEFSDAQGGVGAGNLIEIAPPVIPHSGLFIKSLFDHFGGFAVFIHDGADAGFFDEPGIGFFLAGVKVVDDDGAARGDGFVHGEAGLGDDEMMGAQQLGQLVGPAKNLHAFFIAPKTINQFGAQFGIAPGDDGDVDIGLFEEAVNGFPGFFLAGMDKVKHAARFIQGGRGQIGFAASKFRADGKTQNLDLFRGHAADAQGIGDGFVGDAKKITRRAEPGRTGRERFGHDGDEAERTFAVAAENFLDKMAVSGAGGDDAIGLGFEQDFFQGIVHPGETAELPFHNGGFIGDGAEAIPEDGRVLGEAQAGFME